MKKIFTFLVITVFYSLAFSQTIQKTDSASTFEKARYQKEDPDKFLQKNINYPYDALTGGIQGDVVFTFTITKEGKLENILMIKSVNSVLTLPAYSALSQLDKNWAPATEHGQPIDKKYTIVFRYRMYQNTKPSDPKVQASGYIKKSKYNKALKTYNEAIDDNPYDYQLYESRSKVKQLLGDMQGSIMDHKTSTLLFSDIMSVNDIIAIGVIRQYRTVGFATSRVIM